MWAEPSSGGARRPLGGGWSVSLRLSSPVLKSPQVVLLGARALAQADVVHRHLSAPAPPTLALQDHLQMAV